MKEVSTLSLRRRSDRLSEVAERPEMRQGRCHPARKSMSCSQKPKRCMELPYMMKHHLLSTKIFASKSVHVTAVHEAAMFESNLGDGNCVLVLG